jgi:hypothetical protein
MLKLNKKNQFIRPRLKKLTFYFVFLISICSCILGDEVDSLIKGIIQPTDEDKISNLIETILDASPQARAKAESYAATAAKRNPPPKTPKKKELKTAAPKPSIPVLQIPEEDLLEVSAKFPNNIIGKYVYGPVTIDDFQIYEWDDSAFIGFFAKNMRTFYLETRDPLVIKKFSQLRRGMKFMIPKEFPLRIASSGLFIRYGLHLPSENFLPEQEYLRQKKQNQQLIKE